MAHTRKASFTVELVHAEAAQHIFDWAINDRASYNKLQKLATLGNYVGTLDRFTAASNLAVSVFRKMRKCGDMPGGIAGYSEEGVALAVNLFLNYRVEK